MQAKLYKLGLLSLIGVGVFAQDIQAQEVETLVRQSKSAKQRVAASQLRRAETDAEDAMQKYSDFKDYLHKEYGLGFALDMSFMPQYGAPSGKQTAFQGMISPSVTWESFKNEYGTGTLNVAYNVVQYSGISGETQGNRIGVVTPINDFPTASNTFNELYYTYQLPGSWNWLSVSAGQFPMYNFDGTQYDSNQQQYFINYALSQNMTSTYPLSSLGSFVTLAPSSEWTFIVGAQDATNITGQSISTSRLNEEHYTTFASATYSPNISGLGQGQYGVLVYNQPNVKKEAETTNGWSLNASQDLNEKWAVFGRMNGVSGAIADIKQSYVLGAVYNNPLERNPLDQIGFAAAHNLVNKKAVGEELNHDAETVLEAYWAWGISKWMTITPDVQFYFNPALNAKSDHATVVSLRGSVFF